MRRKEEGEEEESRERRRERSREVEEKKPGKERRGRSREVKEEARKGRKEEFLILFASSFYGNQSSSQFFTKLSFQKAMISNFLILLG